MPVRGVRGAIQVDADTPEAIRKATQELVSVLLGSNPSMEPQDLASVFFTVTDDLSATYPALAVRELPGWQIVPLLCSREIPVPTGLVRTLRVLVHWNTDLRQDQVIHAYLGAASRLRPDLER